MFLEQFLKDETSRALEHVSYVDQAPEAVQRAIGLLQHAKDGCTQQAQEFTYSAVVAEEDFLPFASASHDRALPRSVCLSFVTFASVAKGLAR